jgi:deoxycytidine triphosphate deaminase
MRSRMSSQSFIDARYRHRVNNRFVPTGLDLPRTSRVVQMVESKWRSEHEYKAEVSGRSFS